MSAQFTAPGEPAPPPPGPARGGGSCWKWGGIACLGLGCVGVIAVVVGLALLFQRPEVRRAFRSTRQAGMAVVRLQETSKAIGKYAHDKGKYPAALADITPSYISADRIRPDDEPGTKPFEYHQPPRGAPDDFGMLVYEMPNPIMPGQAPGVRYVLTKGGDLQTISSVSGFDRAQPRREGSPGARGDHLRSPAPR